MDSVEGNMSDQPINNPVKKAESGQVWLIRETISDYDGDENPYERLIGIKIYAVTDKSGTFDYTAHNFNCETKTEEEMQALLDQKHIAEDAELIYE
jgi:hypothetical protein